MKLAIFLNLALAFQAIAEVKAQKITLNVTNIPLREVMIEIKKQQGYSFLFRGDEIADMRISAQLDQVDFRDAMRVIVESHGLGWSLGDGIITIRSANEVAKIAKVLAVHQQRTIVGRVTDEEGNPLEGVTVTVKGTAVAVSTDSDGHYQLEVIDAKGATLVFSVVGYQLSEQIADTRDVINVTMNTMVSDLDEVVVVAFGTQKKATVTGAVASIETKEIRQSPAANLAVTLAGRLPGLTSIQTSGEPGRDAVSLFLRGVGTINGQNPLILVDGVERSINYLDPNEVESISILKDASSTAMFGVRGANGVILVTTKRGQSGRPEINFFVESGIQDFTRLPSRVGAYDYSLLKNQAAKNDGLGNNYFYSDEAINHFLLQDDPIRYPNNDWSKILMNTFVPQTRYNLNLSGGSDHVQYFVNAGYLNQGGQWKVAEDNGYDPAARLNRYNFRSNIDAYLNERKTLKAFLNASGYLENINGPAARGSGIGSTNNITLLTGILNTPNVFAGPLTPDGNVLGSTEDPPYGEINRTGYTQQTRSNVLASFGMEKQLDFLTEGLAARVMMSFDASTTYSLIAQKRYQIWEQYTNPGLIGADGRDSVSYRKFNDAEDTPLSTSSGSSFNSYTNVQAFLNYARIFDKHAVTGLLLYQRDRRILQGDRLPYNLNGGSMRLTYGYADKYFAEFNAGYNGSEQFAKGRRYGFFPSFSAGWLISRERFLVDHPIISILKLRGSYGLVGNDRLGSRRFLYLDDIGVGGGRFPNLGRGQQIFENSIGNSMLSWEIAKKGNLGVELELFRELNIQLDIFNERRDNMLIYRGSVPDLYGFDAGSLPPVNIGRMTNRGYELELTYQKVVSPKLSFLVKANVNSADNRIAFMDEVPLTEDFAYRYRATGYRYGQQFGYVTDGYWGSAEEIDASGLTFVGIQPRPGDLRFQDLSEDGVIDERDFSPIGHSNIPQYTYGSAISVSYGSFDVSLLFQGVAKVSKFYTGWGVFENNNNISMYRDRMLDAWTPDRHASGALIRYPALTTTSSSSHQTNSFYNENTNFVRLKNAELGYTLPQTWARQIFAERIRFYANGINLWTWTKMKNNDFDPEISGTLTYPILRVVNFGANVTF